MPGRSTKPTPSLQVTDWKQCIYWSHFQNWLSGGRFLLLQPGFFVRGAVTGGRFAQVIHSGGYACRGSLLLVCCKQLMSERSELALPIGGILLYVHSSKWLSHLHTRGWRCVLFTVLFGAWKFYVPGSQRTVLLIAIIISKTSYCRFFSD